MGCKGTGNKLPDPRSGADKGTEGDHARDEATEVSDVERVPNPAEDCKGTDANSGAAGMAPNDQEDGVR